MTSILMTTTVTTLNAGQIVTYLGGHNYIVADALATNWIASGLATAYTPPIGTGAVDSVNGQTGTVVLDASDVGALAPDGDGSGLTGVTATVTETDPVVGAITGIVKADGAGNITAATASTDYTVPDDLADYFPLAGGTMTGNVDMTAAGLKMGATTVGGGDISVNSIYLDTSIIFDDATTQTTAWTGTDANALSANGGTMYGDINMNSCNINTIATLSAVTVTDGQYVILGTLSSPASGYGLWLNSGAGIQFAAGAAITLPDYSTITTPAEGMVAWDYTGHAMKTYNGTTWI